ncbi:MAG: hypothetical protein ABJB86_02710 [Bacteroidota bacterium]
MKREYQDAVRSELEHVFGRSIVSSRDCMELSNEIFQKTHKRLNPNTLRRFFGLVKTEYPSSHSTLNILSQYCGFQSAEEVYKLTLTHSSGDLVEQANLVYYFISMFEEITVMDSCDKTFFTIVEHTIKFLNKNLSLVDKFQSLVAKTRNGQDFYFEQLVNIDKFNFYFTNGLRYYLNEKRSGEGMIFAHSVFVFKYWLNKDDTKLAEHYNKMNKFSHNGSFNGYIYCRYYAAILFGAHTQSTPVEDILVSIYKFYSTLEATGPADQLFYFEYTIAEALVLTGHYNDAQFYMDQFANRAKKKEFCKQRMSIQNIQLFRAVAFNKTGQVAEALDIFNALKPAEFHFITKKYAAIFYIYLSTELKRKIFRYDESLESLINETGFCRLKSFCS